jgi:adenine phosphoribosyltransferase
MNAEELKKLVRNVPDFPNEGIMFKDLTTVFIRHDCLEWISEELYKLYKDCGITKIVGIESRGFIMAANLAIKLNAGFVPVRKKGKLPAKCREITYQKEYGKDTIQIHMDALNEDDVVLIHDDLLATGGTMAAAVNLVKKFNVKKIYVNFIAELDYLKGRSNFDNNIEVTSLIHY